MCGRETTSSRSKPGKGKRGIAGQVDYVALSRDLVDAVESGVYIVQSGKFVYVNPFFAKLTGYSPEELIGTRSLKFVLPKDRPAVRKKATRNLRSRSSSKPYEYRFIKRNGEIIWVLERISSIEYMGQKAALGSFVDITGRKQLEEALAHSEKTYRTILEQMYDSYYEVDLAGNFTFVNDSVCRNLGYSSEEMVGQSYRFTTPPDDIKPLLLAFNEVFRTGIPNLGFAHGILRKDGSIISVESSISLRENEQGEIIGFRSVSRDITERKRAEQALLIEKQFSDAVIDSLPGLFYILDEKGNFVRLNNNWEIILGYSVEKLPSMNALAVIAEEDKELVAGKILDTFSNGNAEVEANVLTKSGQKIPHYLTGVRTIIGDKTYLAGEGIDITERKKAEAALKDSEERVRIAMENAPDGIYMNDLEGNFLYGNRRCEEIIGYKREELIGKNFLELNILPEDSLARAAEILQDNIIGKSTGPDELELISKDGRRVPIEINTSVVQQGGEKVVLAFVRDTSERKKSVEALKESEERYRALFDRSLDLVYVRDLNGNFIDANPAALNLLGYRREDIPSLNFTSLLDASQFPKTIQILKELTETGFQKEPGEFKLKSKDGTHLYVETQESMIYRDGKPHSVQGVGRDITERKKAEAALKESEAKYRLVVETTTEVIFVVQDLKIKFFNRRAIDLTGFTGDELNDMPFANLVHPDDLEMLADQHQRRLQGEPFERVYPFRYMLKGGKVGWAEISTALIAWDGRPATLSILNDITERKRIGDRVNHQHAFLRQVIDSSPSLIFVKDGDDRYLLANNAIANAYGTTPEYMQGKTDLELGVPPEEFAKYRQDDIEALQSGKEKIIPDENFTWQSGKVHHYHTTKRPLLDEEGKFSRILAVSVDITERKQSEEALRESEEKYRALVENINDVFYTLDTQGNITYVSPVVERFTRYKVSDLIGKPFMPLIYPDDLPGLLDSFNRLTAGKLEPWEFRILDKDGRVIFVRTSSLPLYKDGEIVGITALMTDITERKQMEQKLEEMATHDFLTGLPNRVLLVDRFTIAAALARRNKARLAIMSLDLDKFKSVNDTLGHDAGDQVLKTISKRLTGIIRASDTLARVGGDEFILVMLETSRVEDATAIAQKILDSFMEPLLIDGQRLILSTSIGVAIYPNDAEDLETLIKKSDAAMYYSKGHGRNQFKFFGDGDVRISGDHRSAPD